MVNNMEIIDPFAGKKNAPKHVRIDFFKNGAWKRGAVYLLEDARERLKEAEEKGLLKYPKYRLTNISTRMEAE